MSLTIKVRECSPELRENRRYLRAIEQMIEHSYSIFEAKTMPFGRAIVLSGWDALQRDGISQQKVQCIIFLLGSEESVGISQRG
jgi:N-acetyl-gamma-glutamylphosphate reductase